MSLRTFSQNQTGLFKKTGLRFWKKCGNLFQIVRDCLVLSGKRCLPRNDVMVFLGMMLLFPMMAQASLISSQLGYDNYSGWRHADQLYYSTFNSGEQWKEWKTSKYTVESLNLVDQINVCYAHGGGWNHYFNDCVIDDEDQLLSYLEAIEDAERFGFHFSAPALTSEKEEDFANIDPEDINWENYETWSPEKQLYFSALGEGEMEGEIIPWELD